MTNWFKPWRESIKLIKGDLLRDPQPGWFSFVSNILNDSPYHTQINSLTKSWSLKISHFYNMYLHTVHLHFHLIKFTDSKSTNDNNIYHIRRNVNIPKVGLEKKATKGRVHSKYWSKTCEIIHNGMCSFTEWNHSIKHFLFFFFWGSTPSLDYFLSKYIIQCQCISDDYWICTVCLI